MTGRLLGLKLDSINYDLVCGGMDGYIYMKGRCLAYCERELERRRLERERLERWQSRFL